MALKNLSIYWDTNAKVFDDMTPDELIVSVGSIFLFISDF